MDRKQSCLRFLNACLNGLSQIMLQRNWVTGLLFLLALFIGNWPTGVAAVIGILVGTITAVVFHFPLEKIADGLYGFSSALVGIALATSFQLSLLVIVALLIAAVCATLLQHFFYCRKVPAFTFPFVLCAWTSVFLLQGLKTPAAVSEVPLLPNILHDSFFLTLSNSFGQVMFQGQVFSGVLILFGVFINVPLATILAMIAAGLAAWVNQFFGAPIQSIEQGLFGFNVVLTALALYGSGARAKSWMGLGVILTLLFQLLLYDCSLLGPFGGMLTFPFVLGTWLTLTSKRIMGAVRKNT